MRSHSMVLVMPEPTPTRYTLAAIPEWITSDIPSITADGLAVIVAHLDGLTIAARSQADDRWDQMRHGEADYSDVEAADRQAIEITAAVAAFMRLVGAAPGIVIEDASCEPHDPDRWRTP